MNGSPHGEADVGGVRTSELDALDPSDLDPGDPDVVSWKEPSGVTENRAVLDGVLRR